MHGGTYAVGAALLHYGYEGDEIMQIPVVHLRQRGIAV